MDQPDYFVHASSFVDEPCEIGPGTKIWHFSHIMKNCRIGKACNIGQNVVISPDVVIGNNVKIQNNVSVYTGCILEDDVFCGPSMVFTNVINPRSHVIRRDEYQTTLVQRGASMGANSTVVCGVTIGRYAFIGAGAVVTRDVPDYALVVRQSRPHSRLDVRLRHQDDPLARWRPRKGPLRSLWKPICEARPGSEANRLAISCQRSALSAQLSAIS